MKYEKVVLDNGIEIILMPIKNMKTFSIKMIVEGAGSAFDHVYNKDSYSKEGVHNFLFEMLQRGTKKYDSYEKLNFELESIGASLSIGVSSSVGSIDISSPTEGLSKSIEIISELYLAPLFDDNEFYKERINIENEIKSIENDPESFTGLEFFNLIYKDTPYAGTGMGTVYSISAMQKQDILEVYNETLCSKPIVFFIVGNFDKKLVIDSIKNVFVKRLETLVDYKKHFMLYLVPKAVTKTRIINVGKKLDQPVFYLGLYGAGINSPDYYTSLVTSSILGAGFGSMIVSEVREKRSLAYYAQSRTLSQNSHGLLYAYGGVNKEKFYEAVEVTIDQFRRIADGDFSIADINRAVKYRIGTMEVMSESLSSKLAIIANYYIATKKIFYLDSLSDNLEKVTKKQIIDYAKSIYKNSFCIAVNGFTKIDEDKIIKLFDKLNFN